MNIYTSLNCGDWIYLKTDEIKEGRNGMRYANMITGRPGVKLLLTEEEFPEVFRGEYENWFVVKDIEYNGGYGGRIYVRKENMYDRNGAFQYKKGQICFGVVNEIKNGQARILIGPRTYASASVDYWESKCEDSKKLQVGMLCVVKITQIQNGMINCNINDVNETIARRKKYICKKINTRKAENDNFINRLYSNENIKISFKDVDLNTALRALGRDVNGANREELRYELELDFQRAREYKRIIVDKIGEYSYESIHRIKEDIGEAPVYVGFRKDKFDESNCFVNFIGYKAKSVHNVFYTEVYVEDDQKMIQDLADKALAENWNYIGTSNNFILKSYLGFTYYMAKMQGKIREGKNDRNIRRKIFDTGLVNELYEPIYAILREVLNEEREKNPNIYQDFMLEDFEIAGTGAGKNIISSFSDVPERVKYINKMEDIVLDTSLNIKSDWEHILMDNINRFPESFFRENCDDSCKEAIDSAFGKSKKRDFSKLKKIIEETKGLKYKLVKCAEDAQEFASKKASWNYKTAVPIYYPARNKISLILPLALAGPYSSKVDLALVVSKQSGWYQGETVLTLDMAYMDSRQITRPDSEWLNSNLFRLEESAEE